MTVSIATCPVGILLISDHKAVNNIPTGVVSVGHLVVAA